MQKPDAKQQAAYYILRNQLIEHNYRGNFGIDSFDLVNALYVDILANEQSVSVLEERESRLTDDLMLAQSQLFPLRSDNAKLLHENRALHKDEINQNDEVASLLADFRVSKKNLEDRNVQLQHLNSALEEKLLATEKENSRIRSALESMSLPSSGSGAMKRQMNVSSTVRKSSTGYQLDNESPDIMIGDETGSVDNIEGDSVVETLRNQVDLLSGEVHKAHQENQRLVVAVTSRENELQRLARNSSSANGSNDAQGYALEGYSSKEGAEKSTNASSSKSIEPTSSKMELLVSSGAGNQRIIDQLNGQVDFLNEQLAIRESQLHVSLEQSASADELQADLNYRLELNDKANLHITALEVQVKQLCDYKDKWEEVTQECIDQSNELKRREVVIGDLDEKCEHVEEDYRALQRQFNVLQDQYVEVQHAEQELREMMLKSPQSDRKKSLPPVYPAPSPKVSRSGKSVVSTASSGNNTPSRSPKLLPRGGNRRLSTASQAESVDVDDTVTLDSLDMEPLPIGTPAPPAPAESIYSTSTSKDPSTASNTQATAAPTSAAVMENIPEVKDTRDQELFIVSESYVNLQHEYSVIENELKTTRSEFSSAKDQIGQLTEQIQLYIVQTDSLKQNLDDAKAAVPVSIPVPAPLVVVEPSVGTSAQEPVVVSSPASSTPPISNIMAPAGMEESTEESIRVSNRLSEHLQHLQHDYSVLEDELQISRQQLSKAEMEISGLKRQINMIVKSAESDKENLKDARHSIESNDVQTSELKLVLHTVESNFAVQSQKMTRVVAALHEVEDALGRSEEEVKQLKGLIDASCNREKDLEEALQSMEMEREGSQNQFDNMLQKEANQLKAHRRLEDQNLQLKQLLERKEKLEQKVSGELVTAQRQSSEVLSRLNAQNEEKLILKKKVMQQQSDLTAAAEDLVSMTRENQAITSELGDTMQERERLRARLTECVQSMTALEQARRALEIEKQDLVNSYRQVLSDKRKIETDFQALGAQRQQAVLSVEKLTNQMAEMKGAIGAQSTSEARWNAERLSLNKQLETLNDECVRSQRKMDAVDADNRRLMQDTYGLKQTNSMLNDRIQMIIKRAAMAADGNKIFATRLTTVERERDALRALMATERQRSTEIGQLLETARTQAAFATSQSTASPDGGV